MGEQKIMETGDIVRREQQYWDQLPEFEWLSQPGVHSIVSNCQPCEGDVLELCSGMGMFTRAMPRLFRSYTCLDVSEVRLARLRRALADVQVVQGDAHKLAFADGSFDYVAVFAGLHHLPGYQMTIKESYRVLRPGGRFICFEPNARCWYRKLANPIRKIIGLFTEDEVFLDPFELTRNLSNAGFIHVEARYMTPRYDKNFLGNPLNRLLGRLVYLSAHLSRHKNWQAFVLMTAQKPLRGEGGEP